MKLLCSTILCASCSNEHRICVPEKTMPSYTDSIIFRCQKSDFIVDMSDLTTSWSGEEDPKGVTIAQIREN